MRLEDIRNKFKISHDTQTKILKTLLNGLYQIHKHVYFHVNINYPKAPCIFAIWHAHQCGVYSIDDKHKTNIMISRSQDGDMIAYATEQLGIKTVRGSQTRGGTAATLELINRLKEGEFGAITIDGPRGPRYVVKKGIIEIARISGVPIVPMTWYCGKNGWFQFNTWDRFCYPKPFVKCLNIFGDPIYVPENINEEEIEKYRKQVEDTLNNLYETAQRDYKKLIKQK